MKKIILQQNNKNTSQGFVLLFSIVVSAIIFFIGAGMYSIASKELVISQLTQDSQKSIFAADAGVECGFLVRTKVFDVGINTIQCLGNNVAVLGSTTSKNFTIGFPNNDTCAKVTIVRNETEKQYLIYGQGYNKCSENNGNWEPVEHLGLTERVYRYPWAYN